MNKQSINSFNKITLEMQRLSTLIHKEDVFRYQLQSVLNKNPKSNSSSSTDNLDVYFKQKGNPTTKSIPFLEEGESQQQNSETINTINKNMDLQRFEQRDRQTIYDEKSTLVFNNMIDGKMQRQYALADAKFGMNYYASANIHNLNYIKDSSMNKSKQNSTKNASSSNPSQISASIDQDKLCNMNTKNFSLSKVTIKPQFHIANSPKKNKKAVYQSDQNTDALYKQYKGKFGKISKIDRDVLTRLQQTKINKKTEQSSNRRKTKRKSIDAKGSITKSHPQKISQSKANLKTVITQKNAASKLLDIKNKQIMVEKKNDKTVINEQIWQKTLEKGSKKLNRINISKLHENMKRVQDKKIGLKDISRRKYENGKDQRIEDTKQVQKIQKIELNFTQQDNQSRMNKLIHEKQLSRQYTRETEKYNETTKRISKIYFEVLIKEFRQSSKEALLKVKLFALMLCFFNQFTTSLLLSNNTKFVKSQFENITEEQLIEVLLHPKKLINLMEMLPNILMNENIIVAQRKQLFDQKFMEINNQLDHQLQLFLIKKTPLYMYMHSLSEYINFLLQKQLIEYTKRSKLIIVDPEQQAHGFYSSRGKKDMVKKYVRRNEGPYKFGFRCDSDRMITLEDEDLYLRKTKNVAHSPSIKQILPRKVLR